MTNEEVLETIGLPEKEAKVYLACLRIGQETAFNIAQKSGLKRSTVYFVLEKLVKKGFASIKKTPKATFYSVINPTKLLLKYESHKDTLEKALPALDIIYREQPHKPKVEIFEGKHGVGLIYQEAIEHLEQGKEVLCFGATEHFSSEYSELLESWAKKLQNKRFKARDILNRSEFRKSKYYEATQKNANPNHQIRFFPKGVSFTENDNLIYGHKLAIFSLKKEVFVILIESENITNSYRQMFEMAWKLSMKS